MPSRIALFHCAVESFVPLYRTGDLFRTSPFCCRTSRLYLRRLPSSGTPQYLRKVAVHGVPEERLEMCLGYVILYVEDVPATIDFYEKAFGQTRKFVTPEEDYGELKATENCAPLAFARRSLGKQSTGLDMVNVPNTDALPFELAFVVEDVGTAVEKALEAGASPVKGATKKPWGQTVAYVRDCNGFLIELCTKVAASSG